MGKNYTLRKEPGPDAPEWQKRKWHEQQQERENAVLSASEVINQAQDVIDDAGSPGAPPHVADAATKVSEAIDGLVTAMDLETAKSDIMRYHTEHEPKIFKKGSVIPVGWNSENRKLWDFSETGKCTKR